MIALDLLSRHMKLDRRSILAGAMAAAAVPRLAFAQDEDESSETLDVPIDHDDPQAGTFPLGFGLLTPFDARRRTVFAVADGQQFYLRPGALERSLGPIFGSAFNVVGVYGRASAPEIQRLVGFGEETDWRQAYRLLRANQWLDDLEAVRRHVAGPDGSIGLYGRSGGGLLAHQFVARHGAHVDRIYTQAAVNPYLEARFGLSSDRFWHELAEGERAALSAIIGSGRYPREKIALLFQRQNFFVPREELAAARAELIELLAASDDAAITQREADYQIDAIAALDETAQGPAIRVRLFEFFAPLAASHARNGAALHPDIEVLEMFARPLMPLLEAGTIAPPSFDLAPLHASRAQACIVAGRWDHTCDYRSQIALAASYPSADLLLLDDDHVFHRLGESGALPDLVRGAMEGVSSPAYRDAVMRIDSLRWRETA